MGRSKELHSYHDWPFPLDRWDAGQQAAQQETQSHVTGTAVNCRGLALSVELRGGTTGFTASVKMCVKNVLFVVKSVGRPDILMDFEWAGKH